MSGRFLKKQKNLIPASFPKSTKFVFVLQLSNGTNAVSEVWTPFTQTRLTQQT